MPQNDFLPFCPVDTGTNLLNETDYLAASGRTDGNQPGLASSKLNNKAIRQGTYIASQLAQFLSNTLGMDVLDNATPAQLLAQFTASLKFYAPRITNVLSTGSGNFNLTWVFQILSGNATAGATYTNNGVTYTVASTVSGATEVKMTGNGAPTLGGTLTKATGTGDSTLTFYTARSALYLRVRLVGGGGGSCGSGSSGGSAAGSGVASTFGTSLLSAAGGAAGLYNNTGGSGGSGSITAPAIGIILPGNGGSVGGSLNSAAIQLPGPAGGGSALFGGAGTGTTYNGGATAGTANTGGGASAPGNGGTTSVQGGSSGGGGGSIDAIIPAPSATYAFVVGTGGAGGGAGAGSGALPGAAGGSGQIEITEFFQ